MFMESLILRVSCKVSEALIMNTSAFHKFNLLLIFTFYYKYLKYKKYFFNLGIKTVLYSKYNCINGLVRV